MPYTKFKESSVDIFLPGVSYHDCIVTVPHDSDADFRLELDVNSILFHCYTCIVVWYFDTEKKISFLL